MLAKISEARANSQLLFVLLERLIVGPFHLYKYLSLNQIGGICFCWLRIFERKHSMLITRLLSQQKQHVSKRILRDRRQTDYL
jgi:hypothetical protein